MAVSKWIIALRNVGEKQKGNSFRFFFFFWVPGLLIRLRNSGNFSSYDARIAREAAPDNLKFPYIKVGQPLNLAAPFHLLHCFRCYLFLLLGRLFYCDCLSRPPSKQITAHIVVGSSFVFRAVEVSGLDKSHLKRFKTKTNKTEITHTPKTNEEGRPQAVRRVRTYLFRIFFLSHFNWRYHSTDWFESSPFCNEENRRSMELIS